MAEQHPLIPLGIGERLTQAREGRKLSIESVAEALRLPADVIASIESEALDRFAPIYRRGYVKSYARYLGLPTEEIERLLATMAADEPQVYALFPDSGKVARSDRWLKATSYVLASLLIGTLAWQIAHEVIRLTGSKGEPGVTYASGEAAVSEQSARQERIDGTGHVNASIAALERLRPNSDTSSPAARAWSALQPISRNGADDAPPLAAGEHRLNVRTSGDSWVEITDAQGRQLELDLLRGGSDKQYRGIPPFRILFGMASAVELYLDGNPVDTGPFTNAGVTQMTLAAPQSDDGTNVDG